MKETKYGRLAMFDKTFGFHEGNDDDLLLGKLQEQNKSEIQKVMSKINQKHNQTRPGDTNNHSRLHNNLRSNSHNPYAGTNSYYTNSPSKNREDQMIKDKLEYTNSEKTKVEARGE